MGWIPVMLWLGYFNFERFGSPFQFGHDISHFNQVKFFGPLSPLFWKAFYGLLFGPGKGLFLFCPAVALGVVCWPAFYRQMRLISILLLCAVVVRTSFLFFYIYWHGAFCLGPRHLIAELPLLLVPCAFWLSEKIRTGKIHSIFVFLFAAWICVLQQIYFCIGEIFSYYHLVKYLYGSKGLDVFAGDYLYLNWHVSPLYRLMEYRRGPFFLQTIPLSNGSLWLLGGIISAVAVYSTAIILRRRLTKQIASTVLT
jgi:hypothetical protein